jgi:hypothetical protein
MISADSEKVTLTTAGADLKEAVGTTRIDEKSQGRRIESGRCGDGILPKDWRGKGR